MGPAVTALDPLDTHAVEVSAFAEGGPSLSRDALIAVMRRAHAFGRSSIGDSGQQDGTSWQFLLGYLNLTDSIEAE